MTLSQRIASMAERYRVGPGYLHDVRAKVKAAREAMERNG